jgi:hypothetical protein
MTDAAGAHLVMATTRPAEPAPPRESMMFSAHGTNHGWMPARWCTWTANDETRGAKWVVVS